MTYRSVSAAAARLRMTVVCRFLRRFPETAEFTSDLLRFLAQIEPKPHHLGSLACAALSGAVKPITWLRRVVEVVDPDRDRRAMRRIFFQECRHVWFTL